MQEELVEEERVAGLEDRTQDPCIAGGFLCDGGGDLGLEERSLGARGDELLQPARNEVEPWSSVAAVREREPTFIDRTSPRKRPSWCQAPGVPGLAFRRVDFCSETAARSPR